MHITRTLTLTATAALLFASAARVSRADPPGGEDKAEHKVSKAERKAIKAGVKAEHKAEHVEHKADKAARKADEKAAKAEEKVAKMEGKETQTTASGLQYIDEKAGTGATPRSGQRVKVHYTGWLKSGKKFDSSVDRGEPFVFVIGAGQVIKGWDEGVATMKVGGKRKLIIPPQLAYGNRDVGGGLIPPNSELTFDVELLGVE